MANFGGFGGDGAFLLLIFSFQHRNVLCFYIEILTVDTASSNNSPCSGHFGQEIVSWYYLFVMLKAFTMSLLV